MSQLVRRFGYKIAEIVQRYPIKIALFADHKLFQLPCLNYTDNFTCQVTELYTKQPIIYMNSAPLLWWLWDELLNYLKPSLSTRGCRLEFTPARETDITLPITISINLSYKNNGNNIELTTLYGGLFHERRIFNTPIMKFCFPEQKRYGKKTMATLNIDRYTYKEEGYLAHMLDYLVLCPGSIWRHAMEALSTEKEEFLVVALIRTCKAEYNHFYMSENQAQQCLNLLQRFPVEAKEYIIEERLVGKKNGPYSRVANLPPGPKD